MITTSHNTTGTTATLIYLNTKPWKSSGAPLTRGLGWHLDGDLAVGEEFRAVQ